MSDRLQERDEFRAAAAERLGVEYDAGIDEIMTAWRAAAREHHPDAGGDAAEFSAVASAVEYLTSTAPVASAEVPVTVGARIERRVMWWALASGSAPAVAVVVLVLIVAPAASTTVPIIMVAAVVVAMKTWKACGRPRPEFTVSWSWGWLPWVGDGESGGTEVRSAAEEFAGRKRRDQQ